MLWLNSWVKTDFAEIRTSKTYRSVFPLHDRIKLYAPVAGLKVDDLSVTVTLGEPRHPENPVAYFKLMAL
jgi:hypothetical protein